MSLRISEGGRLFGIMACVGGIAMIGSASLVWKKGFFAKPNGNGYEVILRAGAMGRGMLWLGLIVIAGAATFIAVGSRRIRIAAGVVVVLAGAAGLVVFIWSADPRTLGSWAVPAACTRSNPADAPCIDHLTNGSGAWFAVWGSLLAVGSGIVALVRSRGEAPTQSIAPQRTVPSDAALPTNLATPPEDRMSDATVFGWTVLALVIVLAFFLFAMFMQFVSQDTI